MGSSYSSHTTVHLPNFFPTGLARAWFSRLSTQLVDMGPPSSSRTGYAPLHHSPDPSLAPSVRALKATPWDDSNDEDASIPLADLFHRPCYSDGFHTPRELWQRGFRQVPSPLRRPLQAVLVLVLVIGLGSTMIVHQVTRSVYKEVLAEAVGSRGWVVFNATTPSPLRTLEPVPSEQVLDPGCLDEWVSTGELCAAAQGAFAGMSTIDVVYAYTNGSAALQNEWRAAIGPAINRATARHFREHDELRYSMRAIMAAFGPETIRSIKLMTTDFPVDRAPPSSLATAANASARIEGELHLGQVPHWLDVEQAGLPEGYPRVEMVHHSSMFTNASQLPTFNSLPIEASLHNVDMAPINLYMNDDFMVGMRNQRLSASDIGSALLGPMLRIDRHMLFRAHGPDEQSEGEQEGEWWGLTRGNWLLSRRFGLRKRGYLQHVPKSMPRALVREAAQHFDWALDVTRQSRFRGSSLEFQPAFIWNHYIVSVCPHVLRVCSTELTVYSLTGRETPRELAVELLRRPVRRQPRRAHLAGRGRHHPGRAGHDPRRNRRRRAV